MRRPSFGRRLRRTVTLCVLAALGLLVAAVSSPGGTAVGHQTYSVTNLVSDGTIPAAHTDVIYAVIVDELGLFGGAAILVIALLFVARGFKAATMATEGFSTLLAAGLSAVFALQVFVIVGGVTRVIPLTGVTLPFVSYGGSSIVANFILVALLLVISDRARRDPGRVRGGLV